MLTYIPFDYLCLQELSRKYDESGVTDAISKYDDWTKAEKFNPKGINTWVSGVEAAFDAWINVAGDSPSYMRAVAIVRGILSPDNEDWRTWAFAFCTSQGEKP